MNVISRGIRNAFRNKIRTFSIVVILSLVMGLTLTMLIALRAVQDRIETVKSSIGNTVSITPAGARGFEGGGEPLTAAQLDKVAQLANVTKVTQTLNDRLTTENTNLQSAVDAGSLGSRRANNSGVTFQGPPQTETRTDGPNGSNVQVNRTFTPPVMISGTNDTSTTATFGGDSVTFTGGHTLDATKDEDKAVIGKTLAAKNSLSVGSTFTAYGKTIEVVGIYDTGNAFSNNAVVMSLSALQRISGQANQVTSAIATVNSIDNIDSAVTAIKSSLGDAADVVNNQETAKSSVAPLENVKTISLYSLIGSLVAGAVIILLTMVMIVRERRREIGVMKAIGASNTTTVFQFMTEAVTLTAISLVVGLVVGIAAASPITSALVTNSADSASNQGPVRGMPRTIRGFGISGNPGIRDVQTKVGVDTIAYGMSAALVIALIGSALPAYLISKVRPAEVMRVD